MLLFFHSTYSHQTSRSASFLECLLSLTSELLLQHGDPPLLLRLPQLQYGHYSTPLRMSTTIQGLLISKPSTDARDLSKAASLLNWFPRINEGLSAK